MAEDTSDIVIEEPKTEEPEIKPKRAKKRKDGACVICDKPLILHDEIGVLECLAKRPVRIKAGENPATNVADAIRYVIRSGYRARLAQDQKRFTIEIDGNEFVSYEPAFDICKHILNKESN